MKEICANANYSLPIFIIKKILNVSGRLGK